MFDPSLLNEPSQSKLRDAVRKAVRAAIDGGTFTYTDLQLAQEPLRTIALEYLDGVTVKNGIPTAAGSTIENWEGGQKFRLVHIRPGGRITYQVAKDVPIFGTDKTRRTKGPRDFGPAADVPDTYPDRVARNILFHKGWPMRQAASNGGTDGEVVEWKWLEREANKDEPAPGVRELYEELLARQASTAEAATPSKKTQPPAQQRAGASP